MEQPLFGITLCTQNDKQTKKHLNHPLFKIFIDRSTINDSIGAGIIFNGQINKDRLPPLTSIYGAEMFSIYKASQLILEENKKKTAS